ncbi:MAG: nucleotide pyrophosphohydrolase [Actinomycetia bacterium]|nr:nucleotide pyrophosphohydrolase [Actinomycetes bacterium]
MLDITALQAHLRLFAAARDWDQFHTPKNLAMAIAGEAGELAAVLQWVEGSEALDLVTEGGELADDFADEMADVMIYLARLADMTGIDLAGAVEAKMARNELRFPPLDGTG